MANLQETLTCLLFTVFFWSICAYLVSYIFGVFTVKFLLNQFTTHKMNSFEENIVTRLRIIVLCYSSSAYHQSDTRFRRQIVTKPHYDAKDGRFAKFCHTPLNCRFLLVIKRFSFGRPFRAVSVKFSLNRITAQNMTNLQNTVKHLLIIVLAICKKDFTRLWIFVLILFFGAFHHSHILELLR